MSETALPRGCGWEECRSARFPLSNCSVKCGRRANYGRSGRWNSARNATDVSCVIGVLPRKYCARLPCSDLESVESRSHL